MRDGDSSDEDSGSQISHLSLSHTNELLTKKKLDSENRPSKIRLQAGSQLSQMKQKQEEFDNEARKQFKKKCLHAKMEQRMARQLEKLRAKYSPEEFQVQEAVLKEKLMKQLQRHIEEHDHDGSDDDNHSHTLSHRTHGESKEDSVEPKRGDDQPTFREANNASNPAEKPQGVEMDIDEYVDQNGDDEFFDGNDERQRYVSFAAVRPSTQDQHPRRRPEHLK